MIFNFSHPLHRWLLIAFSGVCLNAVTHAQTNSPKSVANAGRDFIVAVVDTSPITNHDVNQRVQQTKQQARQQDRSQSQVTPSLQVALEKLITEKALLQHAIEQGIDIDANTLNQALERSAAQNQLSVEAFRTKLTAEGTTWLRFQQTIKEQLILQRLAERNVPARIRVSDAEIDAVMRERMNARSNINPNIELAHILIAVPEQATAAQVGVLQARAQNTLQRLLAGENFADVAKEVSNSSEKDQGGRMGMRPNGSLPFAVCASYPKPVHRRLESRVQIGCRLSHFEIGRQTKQPNHDRHGNARTSYFVAPQWSTQSKRSARETGKFQT